jgi:uncharacterized protein (TIGR02268 family)
LSVSPSFIVLTWGLVLCSVAGAAEPEDSGATFGVRRIEVSADPVTPLPEVHIAPGLSTTLFFDSRMEPERMVLEGHERFQRVGTSEDHLALVPSGTFRPGERLRLEVRFHDGAAPERIAVLLVVDAARVDRQVEVFRRPRRAESYRQEVEELKAGLLRLRREVERLRVIRAPEGGVEAWVAALQPTDEFMNRKLSHQRVDSRFPVYIWDMRNIRLGQTWAGLKVYLEMKEQGTEWTAVRAELLDAQGRKVKVLPPVQQAPLRFKQHANVMIPLEDARKLPKGVYTLKLVDEGGERPVIIEGIEVP